VGKSRTAVTNTLRLLQSPPARSERRGEQPSLRATPVPPRTPDRASKSSWSSDHRRGLDRAVLEEFVPCGEWSPS